MNANRRSNYSLRMQQEKSPYKVIALLVGLLGLVAVGVGYYVMSLYVYAGAVGISILAAAFVVFLAILIYQLMTVKLRRDLNLHDLQVRKVIAVSVLEIQDVEPGSGATYIPILGLLMPKMWGQRMRPVMRYVLQASDGLSYPITKEEKAEIGEGQTINLLFGKRSGIFVGVESATTS